MTPAERALIFDLVRQVWELATPIWFYVGVALLAVGVGITFAWAFLG